MDQNDSVRISPVSAKQQEVMRHVVAQLQDTPYILKGGSALLFTRGLSRHTTDLDFDAFKPLNIERRISDGLKAAGVQVKSLKTVKNTSTVQRFKVHYEDPSTGKDVLFKVETSFRNIPSPEDIETVNGVRTYNVSLLFEQKLNALEGRTEARDLYDVAHLLQHYGNELSTAQIERVDDFSKNLDGVAERFKQSFRSDDVLIQFTDSDETVLRLRDALEQQQSALLQEVQDACTHIVKIMGEPKGAGSEVVGENYVVQQTPDHLSISSLDGRGLIYQKGNEEVVNKLSPKDIDAFRLANAKFKQAMQQRQQHQQQRSPRRGI